ncbi:MAG: SUMF1/EgtB/PvdO family nonheme iron enzyme [Gemmataceae bacterium]
MVRSAWLISLCGLIALCVAHVFGQPAVPGKKYAILVGVNEDQHERLPNLKYAERDVEELAKILEPAGYKVTLLTGSAKDATHRATKATIEKQIKGVLDQTLKGDIVILAFAGHGLQFEDQPDAFFCPTDARPFKDEVKSLVSLGGVYSQLDKSFAGMKVLLVDACRNEPGKRSGTRGGIDADNAPRPPSGVAALFSCRAGEVAHESDKVKHGIFFHHVLESLKGEAANRKGEVTFASMASYVSQSVAADVPKLVGDGARQSPNLKADYSTEPVLLSVSVPSTPPPPLPKDNPPPPPTGKALTGKNVTLDLGGGVKVELVRIPSGDFMMGAPDSDEGATRDLKPRHQVQIKHDFYLGKYEVTQEQYQQVMGKNPSWFSATGQHKAKVQGLDTKRFPVEGVNFADAMAFCQKVSASTGHKVTLPTEAQWEFACRAGSQTKFHFGDEFSMRLANCKAESRTGKTPSTPSLDRPTTVGSYYPNIWGLYDMHGNVWEWCLDWYDEKAYQRPAGDEREWTGGQQQMRVQRGGSWSFDSYSAKSSMRHFGMPEDRYYGNGFRVCVRVE